MTHELEGGWGQENAPVRIDGMVHRECGENAEYVHGVLELLEQKSFGWAPRYHGLDETGREKLDFIEGYSPHGQQVPAETWSLETMTEIFQHIRELHDVTEGDELAEDAECVCHGDLGYANTVYRDGRAVAFIDWDLAHAGRRVDDVAHAIMQYLSLGEYEGEDGPDERAELARKLADAYGLSADQRAEVIDSMLTQLKSIREGQLAATKGDSILGARLAEAGVPEILLKRHAWLTENRSAFEKALS